MRDKNVWRGEKADPRVAIIGCGFGGLWAARTLARAPVDLLVIDRNNYHTFFPLLYQVAAALVEPEHIAYPVRGILRKIPNARFALAEVQGIDWERRVIQTEHSEFSYDFLVITTGSRTNFFDISGAEKFSFPLRTLNQAIRLRNHILLCFERAMQEKDEKLRRRILTFSIVGGGPTGVEFAGALAELIQRPLKRDFPGLKPEEMQIVLLEAAGALLRTFPESIQLYTRDKLKKKGVDVRLEAVVGRVASNCLKLNDGPSIPTETVVWTAGVKGMPDPKVLGLPANENGQVPVRPTLEVEGFPNVYVIGDLACLGEIQPPLPMVAPVAIQQGKLAAENIKRRVRNKSLSSFSYRDRGMMATIGRKAGAVHLLNKWTFTGFTAWLLWLSIHIFYLIGFRNRIFVMVNWALDYFLFERKVMLILPQSREE